jgi:hypothetical protein
MWVPPGQKTIHGYKLALLNEFDQGFIEKITASVRGLLDKHKAAIQQLLTAYRWR